MNLKRIARGVFLCGALLTALVAVAADSGSISGVVQGPDGKPIQGAVITLAAEQNAAAPVVAASGIDGRYQFDGVPLGEFRLSAALTGYVSAPAKTVTISASALQSKIDFTLMLSSAPAESGNAPGSQAAPKFAAAGVRGLIDPGGYSAPANAAAALGLIKGMADIKRGEKESDASAAGAFPCSEEPELRTAVQADSNNASAKQKLGNFYVAHGEVAKAVPLLEQAQQLNAADQGIAKDLAIAYLKGGKFEDARNLLMGMPTKPTFLNQLLARADEGSGMFRQASEQYQAAALEKPSEENLFGVGYELILAGLPADAESAMQSGLQTYPKSIDLLIGAGTAEFLQGHAAAGVHYLLQATDLQPGDPRAYPFLASASEVHEEESDRIRESFKRFHELAPDSAEASYYYAVSLWNSREGGGTPAEIDKIEALLKRAIELAPNFAKAHFQLGALYFDRGNYQGAVRENERTVRLAPEMKEAHFRLANSYKHTGQADQAAREMRLFEAERAQQSTANGGAGISIEQFISVIAEPGEHGSIAQVSCPGPPR
jgi:tetratricopeptide (TPR) repeat protein